MAIDDRDLLNEQGGHGLNGHFYDCARGKVRAGPSPGAATEAGDLVLLNSTRAAIQRITGRPQITL